MDVIDALLENNAAYARDLGVVELTAPPAKELVVVACMDARMDLHRILGLEPGDAHVIRNAGGVVTEDVLRSLAVSQHALGTRELLLIHHTECGMLGLDEDDLKRSIEEETGRAPDFPLGAFTSLEDNVRVSIESVRESGFLRFDVVRGFVYDVRAGLMNEVRT